MPYGVGIVFAMNSIYKNVLNEGIMKAFQSGFMVKFSHDVEWEMMRSATGKLLQVFLYYSLHGSSFYFHFFRQVAAFLCEP